MTTLFFVPGLQGHLNVGKDIPSDESNRAAAERAAQRLMFDFKNVAYQTEDSPFPTLSRMGSKLAGAFTREATPSLCAAMSVGLGAFVQSLRNMFSIAHTPPHVIGVMGVPDPLTAIELQVQHTKPEAIPLLNAVKAGKADEFPLPVIKADYGPEPGNFILEPEHFSDKNALRVLANPADRKILSNYIGSTEIFGDKRDFMKIPSMLLITSKDDPFYQMNLAFAEIAQPWVATPIEVEEWGGSHGAIRSHDVEQRIVRQAQKLGL